MVDLDRERVWGIHLDEDSTVIAVECISQGSMTQSLVHPRDTLKNAVAMGTRRMILVHNHPSGAPGPSPEDILITQKIGSVAAKVGVELSCHVIVGTEGWNCIGADGHHADSGKWEAEPSDARPISVVEGRIKKQVPRYHVDLFGATITTPSAAAEAGRRLLNPTDQIAAALLLDQQHKVIGVFPVAGGTIDGAVSRLGEAVLATSATAIILVAGKDGEIWQNDFAKFAQSVNAISDELGIRHLDSVSVGRDGYRSTSRDHTVLWG